MNITFSDLAAVRQLDRDRRNVLASRPLAHLRMIDDVTGCDQAGIAIRGGSVYAEILDGHYDRRELAALVLALYDLRANYTLVGCAESAVIGDVDVFVSAALDDIAATQ